MNGWESSVLPLRTRRPDHKIGTPQTSGARLCCCGDTLGYLEGFSYQVVHQHRGQRGAGEPSSLGPGRPGGWCPPPQGPAASAICHTRLRMWLASRWLVSRTGAGRDIRGDLSLFNFHSWLFLTVGLISVIGIEATISFHLLWAVFSSNLLQGCQTYSSLRNKK